MLKLFYVFLIGIISIVNSSFADESKAISFNSYYTGDFGVAYKIGKYSELIYMGKAEMTANFDFEKLGLWKGASFFLHGYNRHGHFFSQDLIQDFQIISNIDIAEEQSILFQYYLNQKIGDFTISLGQKDFGVNFSYSDHTQNFLNSSMGIMPTLSLNMPMSIFPRASIGGVVSWDASENINLTAGVYNGEIGLPEDNPYNLNHRFSTEGGITYAMEGQYKFISDSVKEHAIRIGGVFNTGEYMSMPSGLDSKKNYSVYCLIDNTLYTESKVKNTGLKSSIRLGYSPGRENKFDKYLGVAFVYNGPIKSREEDQVGFAFSSLILSEFFLDYQTKSNINFQKAETDLEFYYLCKVNENIILQPCVAYIIASGGLFEKHPLATMLRFKIAY